MMSSKHKRLLVSPGYFLILFCFCLTAANAQSGRTVSPAGPVPAQPAPVQMPDKYPPCQKDPQAMIYIRFTKINAFFDKLNELGNCGYRLEKAAKFWLSNEAAVVDMELFGVVRLEAGNKYEYNWTAAASPGEVQTIANRQAAQNFYFRQQILFVSGSCSETAEKERRENADLGSLGDILNLGLGAKGAVLFFERQIGKEVKNEYKVLDARVTGKKGEREESEKIIAEYVARGFRPVDYFFLGSFNTYCLILEKDVRIVPQGEYRLVNDYYGVNKKLTALSREGFRLVMVGMSFAVMHRTSKDPQHVKYYSSQSFEKIEKNIPKWDQAGFRYEATGIGSYNTNCDPGDSLWFFSVAEPGSPNAPRKTDHILFDPYSQVVEYLKKKGVTWKKGYQPREDELDEIMKEANQTINSYVKQGYVLSNVSMTGNPALLFERPQN